MIMLPMNEYRLSPATRRAVFRIALIPLFPFLAQAQRRSVRGVVTDQSGARLKGAVVQLKDLLSLRIRSYFTGKDGAYHLHGLNPDFEYEVKADYKGASSKTERLDRFASDPEVVVDIEISTRQ